MSATTTVLRISETVINRLLKLEEPTSVSLYGTFLDNTLLVVGLHKDLECNDDFAYSLPAEVDLCGFADFNSLHDSQRIQKCLTDVDITDNPVFISYELTGGIDQISAYLIVNDNLKPTEFTVVSEKEIFTEFIQVRVKAELPYTSDFTLDAIKNAFTSLRLLVQSGKMVFNVPQNNVFLLGGDDTQNSLVCRTGDPTVNDLCNSLNEVSEGTDRKKKMRQFQIDVLSIRMLQKVTKDGGQTPSNNHGPVCILDRKQSKTINIEVPIDALAFLNRNTKVVKLYDILVETVMRNLRLYEKMLLDSSRKHMECLSVMSLLEIFHFYPDECGHFVTLIYAKDDDDTSLRFDREILHEQLLLPSTIPLFRRANRYVFQGESHGCCPLVNPHVGLKPPDNDGDIAIVRGKYKYFHYCQDGLNDNGWGCAYRSLQTLTSWFVLQGYRKEPIPTHKDIQKCLVDIGDKPDSFIGTKQWIGSTEVSFVLETLFGITSRILHVTSGAEMDSVGPELLSHFQTHGSPVMIGGGVLAHTILGVSYDRTSGDIKFLILDPHYTGSEDLQTIQGKGWCGWKGLNFWDKTAYYNICLPQVPITI